MLATVLWRSMFSSYSELFVESCQFNLPHLTTAECTYTLQWDAHSPQKICPFPWGDLDAHLIYGSSGPPKSSTQKAARSVQPFLQGSLVWQTNRGTDRPTDHATRSLRTGRIYVHSTAMRPKNALPDPDHTHLTVVCHQKANNSTSTCIQNLTTLALAISEISTVTMSLSGELCHPHARTCYDQIWNLFHHLLRTDKRRRKTTENGIVWVVRDHSRSLEIASMHRVHTIPVSFPLFYLILLQRYSWILVKNCQLYPTLPAFRAPANGDSIRISAWSFTSQNKTRVRHCLCDPMLSHFCRTPTCDRQTDIHRDRALAQRHAVTTFAVLSLLFNMPLLLCSNTWTDTGIWAPPENWPRYNPQCKQC